MVKQIYILFILMALCHSVIVSTITIFSGDVPAIEVVEEENQSKDGNEIESNKLKDLFFSKKKHIHFNQMYIAQNRENFYFLLHIKESIESISIDYPH